MGRASGEKAKRRRLWDNPTLDEQVERAEEHGLESLLYCNDPWAVNRYWVSPDGEYQRARCNRWECPYCGPRKVNQWRRLVEEAGPTLFLTLSKAGKTLEEAERALTTFIQALRRGSKGKGPNHVGARDAYPVAYYAVLEMHKDFEHNGFHWHLLIKGVDFIPYKEVIKPLWTSAIKGKRTEIEMLKQDYGFSDEEARAFLESEDGDGKKRGFQRLGHIERIKNAKVAGYVLKYMMKKVTPLLRETKMVKLKRKRAVLEPVLEPVFEETWDEEQGQIVFRQMKTYRVKVDEQGQTVEEEVEEQFTRASKVRRIRYSRHFFPEKVADLRKRLFAGLDGVVSGDVAEASGKPLEGEQEEQRRGWRLVERDRTEENEQMREYEHQRRAELLATLGPCEDGNREEYEEQLQEVRGTVADEVRALRSGLYRQRKRALLREVFEDLNEGRMYLSKRVINLWFYRRKALRLAG